MRKFADKGYWRPPKIENQYCPRCKTKMVIASDGWICPKCELFIQ